MIILLQLISIAESLVVPISPVQTNSIRVFCFTDDTNDVSFDPDKKCKTSCGYYENQNSCCKVWVFTEDTVVRCYQSGQRRITLEFTAVILPTRIKQTRNKTASELLCINEMKDRQVHSSAQSSLYMQYAYLYDGTAKQYDPFFSLEAIKLPADESEVECNKTKYAFHQVCPENKRGQSIEIMMILMIGLILVVIFHLTYIQWQKRCVRHVQ